VPAQNGVKIQVSSKKIQIGNVAISAVQRLGTNLSVVEGRRDSGAEYNYFETIKQKMFQLLTAAASTDPTCLRFCDQLAFLGGKAFS
jgi:hypothetical protein